MSSGVSISNKGIVDVRTTELEHERELIHVEELMLPKLQVNKIKSQKNHSML